MTVIWGQPFISCRHADYGRNKFMPLLTASEAWGHALPRLRRGPIKAVSCKQNPHSKPTPLPSLLWFRGARDSFRGQTDALAAAAECRSAIIFRCSPAVRRCATSCEEASRASAAASSAATSEHRSCAQHGFNCQATSSKRVHCSAARCAACDVCARLPPWLCNAMAAPRTPIADSPQ